ncbi:uncharacterized protein LOC117101226 [Anneissia japonica]|uniref:uncharacterized protein LOC117101226 n=1 Tax=Anneissia japonica TaxID=1529436 RepID=UPI001425BB50|nr:uncharacterized protein LOC117101226 [Anneissia japonica]
MAVVKSDSHNTNKCTPDRDTLLDELYATRPRPTQNHLYPNRDKSSGTMSVVESEVCQLCGVLGHKAPKCHMYTKPRYNSNVPPRKSRQPRYYVVEKLSEIHVRLRDKSNILLPQKIHINRLKHGIYRYDLEDTTHTQPTMDDNQLSTQLHHKHADKEHDTSEIQDKEHDTSEKQTEFYEIEKILYKQFVNGQWKYRVKWLSFPSKYNSWVTFDDLSPECQNLVQRSTSIPTKGQHKH